MDNSIEIWKDIEGYEGLYQVSNQGRVKSLNRKVANAMFSVKEHIVKEADNGRGYKFVSLWENNKEKKYYIHRLVALTFIPNPNGYKYINHKDEDKSNNHVYNLEWCTAKYNCNYGNHKKKLIESYIANGNNRPIDVYDMSGRFIKTYDCSNEVCKELGIGRRVLYLSCQGVTKSCKGYRFAFHGEPLKSYEKCKGPLKVVHVFKYDSEGYLVSWYNSIRDAERDNGMGRGYLRTHNIKHNGNIIKDGFRFVLAVQ